MAKILVVDDEENIRKTLTEILEDERHEVFTACDGEQGLRMFENEQPDAVLLDIQLPKKDGMQLLNEIKAAKTNAEVIMLTGHGTIELAVQAIKAGAYHFLQKPLSMVEVKQNTRHAAELKQQRDELLTWRQSEDSKYEMIGKSQAMENIKQQIVKVAPTNGRVLISGESGTGKEVIAYSIHKHSNRGKMPFVKINCAAIPQNLIESELFGHEKGAFTGALSQKKGKFEVANGGTLLLDEIGDMDLNTQTKVLRAIQEGEFERVGGIKTLKVDVRILAATHRNLEEMIQEGKFREDLYYRLNVIPIHIPSLAERSEDIPLLAEHFLAIYCKENGTPARKFTPDALAFLGGRKYPGNIRELRNVVERVAIMSEGQEIDKSFVNSIIEAKQEGGSHLFTQPRPLQQAKDELERAYVQTQLEINDWNIPQTAEVLGIQRTNLHRKIKQLRIQKK